MSHRLSLTVALTITFIALWPWSTNAQTPDAKTAPAGSVSGRVTITDKGVPDIVVVATPANGPGRESSARATTDANGIYRLTGLPAGQYQIIAIAPANAPAPQTESPYGYGPGKVVLLAAGEDVADIDLRLVRGSVITGRVTDADNKPVTGQRVNLTRLAENGNQIPSPETVMTNYQMGETDDRGIYRYYGLPAGRYQLSVGSDNSYMSSGNHAYYKLTFYPDTNDATKASVVELQEGSEASNIDIHLGQPNRTHIAKGRVVDADTGEPLGGVRLMYGPARPNQPFYGGFIGAPIGERGEFRIEGLEPGRYGVSIAGSFDTTTAYSDPLFFEVSDSDVNNLELKANRGLTLSGVVSFEGSRAAELQKQSATLRITASVPLPNDQQTRTSSSAAIGPDGSFQLRGVRPGKVTLYIGGMMNPNFHGSITRIDRGGVELAQGFDAIESIPDLHIVLTQSNGAIRGTVRFVGGDQPAGIFLRVSARREGTTSYSSAMVDSRGRFVMTNLVSGSYEVSLMFMSGGSPPTRPWRPQRQTVVVTDEAETEADFIVDLNAPGGGP